MRQRSPVTARLTLALALCSLAACGPLESSLPVSRQRGTPEPPHAQLLSRDNEVSPAIRRCLADSTGTVPRFTDDEPFAAVDPNDSSRIIAVWQTRSGVGSVIQWVRSEDGGHSWTLPAAAAVNACAGGPTSGARLSSDPWATFGPDGRVYISAIAWTPAPDDGPDEVSALVVIASPDGGRTWAPPVTAAVAPSREIAHDNLAITADPMRPRTVYAATTRAETPARGGYYGRLGFTKSNDGGGTWIPIRAITPAVEGERIGAPQIVVDPRNGRLYAVYHRSRAGQGFIGVMISEDGGDTWQEEVVAARHVRSARTMHPATGRRFVLAEDIIQSAVSPVTGELLIVYADARHGDPDRTSVSVVRSPDGRTWSPPRDVSRTRDKAWLPTIAVAANGVPAVTYYAADFAREQSDPRMRVLFRTLPRSSADTAVADALELVEAPLEWPGDYTVMVSSGNEFVAVYGIRTDIVAQRVVLDRAAIEAASRAFSDAYVRGDVEAMLDLYTPEAVILPPNRPILRGREALRDYWTSPAGLQVLEHAATADSVAVAGNRAYDWGTYRVRTQDRDEVERVTLGKYVIVWVRDGAGRWRMLVDMWNAGS